MACRLCLCTFNDDNYLIISDNTKSKIQCTIPEILLSLSYDPLICISCESFIDEIYVFKNMCLKSQNTINHFIKNRSTLLTNRDLVDIAKTVNSDGISSYEPTDKIEVTKTEVQESYDQGSSTHLSDDDDSLFEYEDTEYDCISSANIENFSDEERCPKLELEIDKENEPNLQESPPILVPEITIPQNNSFIKAEFTNICENTNNVQINDRNLQTNDEVHKSTSTVKLSNTSETNNNNQQIIKKSLLKKFITQKSKKCVVSNFECPLCNFNTDFDYIYNKHILEKHVSACIKCKNCNFQAGLPNYMKYHLKFSCNLKKKMKFCCKICPYKSLHKQLMDRHLYQTHLKRSDLTVFSCSKCKYRTTYKEEIKRHNYKSH